MPHKRFIAVLIALLGAAILGGSALAASGHSHELPDSQLAELRRATAQFHRVEVALAAGYELGYVNGNGVRIIAGCIAHPTLGAMGYHYFNKALIDDLVVDPLKPEGLVYETSPSGELRLVSVEYVVPGPGSNPPGVSEPPTVFGMPMHILVPPPGPASGSTTPGSGSTTRPACSPTGIPRSPVPEWPRPTHHPMPIPRSVGVGIAVSWHSGIQSRNAVGKMSRFPASQDALYAVGAYPDTKSAPPCRHHTCSAYAVLMCSYFPSRTDAAASPSAWALQHALPAGAVELPRVGEHVIGIEPAEQHEHIPRRVVAHRRHAPPRWPVDRQL